MSLQFKGNFGPATDADPAIALSPMGAMECGGTYRGILDDRLATDVPGAPHFTDPRYAGEF
jgi:hypothetical protein